ncbi:MAG: GSCFA domain-containing protein, partial [Chitinophagaceae bacterium]
MKLTTPVPIVPSLKKIDYNSFVFSAGSCFAENMAQKLEFYQFSGSSNPLGILFHPLALLHLFDTADSGNENFPDTSFFHNEKWHYPGAHSKISNPDRDQLKATLGKALLETRNAFFNATHFIFTLGTAWVYREVATAEIVANCHKLPQHRFEKVLLSAGEIAEAIARLSAIITKHNPSAQQIFTVSPVRHIKDGVVGNQRSKANLISGLHTFLESSTAEAAYFPSYEILLDELRDYRFYADDLLHPSAMAIEYIWEKFVAAHMEESAVPVMQEVEALR